LALEAESERYRDTWVEALEWVLLLFREATKDKAAQSQGKENKESDQVLDPLLVKGAMFTKHGLQGITRRYVKCSSTHIYWLKGEDSPLTECIDPIAWETVSEILRGKQTLMFSRSRAKAVADELCVSIVYRADHRSLDLVADSEEQAFEFYSAFSGYLQELQEKYAKSKSKLAMEAELESVRATLAKERDQHIKSVSELAEQSTKTESELEQLQKQREALHSKYSNRESEMEALKNMMQEEKGQLVERIGDLNGKIKDLTQQLDTELQRNATLLEELQSARAYKLELLALRQEVAEQRSARTAMSLELSTLLATWNTKFGSLHSAITKPQGTGTNPVVSVTPPS
jgi:DNA repair exonuclease SbcCD ATPase subunit